MSYVLRDYQQNAVDKSVKFLMKGGKTDGGLVVLPTGAGKSFVIAGIAKELDGPCLVFQPSKEILEQNATKMLAYGLEPKVFSASVGVKDVGSITLATIGSVVDNPDLFDHVPYVLIDEAHLVSAKKDKESGEAVGMYGKFLEALGDVRIVGLTATPYRLHTDGYGGSMLKFLTRTRPKVFSDVLAYAQVKTLIDQGHLVRPEYQGVPGFNVKQLTLNTTGADYVEESIKREFNRIGFHDRLRRVVIRLLELGRKNVLVFTRFVDDAERLAEQIPGTAVVTSKTKPKAREDIVNGFKLGHIKVVANVGVLTTGFDFPALETVVLARPTVSLALYYQQVGRLLRPHPDKADAWVVDMVDQVRQFGKIEDLWLQPGGKTGAQWEMISKTDGIERILTNRYFGENKFQPRNRNQRWRKRA